MAAGACEAWSGAICDQETERQMLLLLIRSGTQGHGTDPLTFRMGLSFSVKPLWKYSHRYTQQFISKVLLHPVQIKHQD